MRNSKSVIDFIKIVYIQLYRYMEKCNLYTITYTFTQNFAKTIHSCTIYRGFRIHHILAIQVAW